MVLKDCPSAFVPGNLKKKHAYCAGCSNAPVCGDTQATNQRDLEEKGVKGWEAKLPGRNMTTSPNRTRNKPFKML